MPTEIFNKYLVFLTAEKNASPYTVRNYTRDLLEFFAFVTDKKIESLKDVNKLTLRSYLACLMEQKYAKSSIARKLSAIRSFYRYLMREELISASPAATTVSPKLHKRRAAFLTVEEG